MNVNDINNVDQNINPNLNLIVDNSANINRPEVPRPQPSITVSSNNLNEKKATKDDPSKSETSLKTYVIAGTIFLTAFACLVAFPFVSEGLGLGLLLGGAVLGFGGGFFVAKKTSLGAKDKEEKEKKDKRADEDLNFRKQDLDLRRQELEIQNKRLKIDEDLLAVNREILARQKNT